MNSYKYCTTDNRMIFSPVPLDYALTVNNTVNINNVTPTDTKRISIVANSGIAEILSAAQESVSCKQRWTDSLADKNTNTWYLHNYCVLVGDKIHIRDGNEYIPLSSFLETATAEEMKYVLTQVAMQATLCRAELLQQVTEVVAG